MTGDDYGYAPIGGMQVKPDGSIGYLFPGGVELLTHETGELATPDFDPSATLPADRSVTWLRESTGAVLAKIGASSNSFGGAPRLHLQAETVEVEGRAGAKIARLAASAKSDPPGISVRLEYPETANGFTVQRQRIATLLRGDGTSDFIQQPEAVRLVGTAGQPAFQSGWANLGPGGERAGFYKWAGRVWLQGLVIGGSVGSTSSIFELPAGYRPRENTHFASVAGGAFGFTRVDAAGQIRPWSGGAGVGTWWSLDGMSFPHA